MEKEVYIVGGGPSLEGFNFNNLKGKDVIVTNKSLRDVPDALYFITVDYIFLRKINPYQIQQCKASKIFIACLHFDYIKEENGKIFDERNGIVYDLSPFDVIIKSRRIDGFGFTFNDFRDGLNSGYCALQLAVILGYKKINLLGFDLQIISKYKTHYHEGYHQNCTKFIQNLDKYYEYFVGGLLQLKENTNIKVISHSKKSRLNNIIEYKDFS